MEKKSLSDLNDFICATVQNENENLKAKVTLSLVTWFQYFVDEEDQT